MRARYLAGNTDMMKVRGSKHDTGEVLRLLLDLGARPVGPMAVRPHVADRRQRARLRDAAARGRPRQYPEPLRLSLRDQRECARRALLRRGRGAALLHLRQDRPRGAGPARRARLSDLRSEGHQVLPLSGAQGDVRGSGHDRRACEEDRHRAEGARAHGRGIQPRLPRRHRRSIRAARTAKPPRVSLSRNRTGPYRIDEPPFRAYR